MPSTYRREMNVDFPARRDSMVAKGISPASRYTENVEDHNDYDGMLVFRLGASRTGR